MNTRLGFASPTVQLKAFSDAGLTSYLVAAKQAGAKYIRFDLDWWEIEGTRGARNFTVADRIVNAIVSQGLSPVAILGSAPSWAWSSPTPSNSSHAPSVAYINDWGSFVTSVVTRYKTRISAWEIFNEPNLNLFWYPTVDPVAYTAFLKKAYSAIKTVQPSGIVVTAGMASVFDSPAPPARPTTSMTADRFLTAVYDAGGKGYFDAVGAHPYTYPCDATDDSRPSKPYDGWTKTLQMRNIMTQKGDGAKKLWITEVGYPVSSSPNPMAVSEAQQSAFLTNTVSGLLAQSFIENVFVYTLCDPGIDAAGNDLNFGLLRHDGSARPAYLAIKSLNGN